MFTLGEAIYRVGELMIKIDYYVFTGAWPENVSYVLDTLISLTQNYVWNKYN